MKHRAFISSCCIGLAILTLGFGTSYATGISHAKSTSKPAAALPSRSYHYADFKPYLGESFSVFGGNTGNKVWTMTVELKLIEISELRKDRATEQFWVRFQGPADYSLDKGVYTFEQAKTGQFKLFLEPAGVDAKGRYYQAHFNLLK